jgi:RNA polymerase sigma factor (sigma-70 family)
MYLYISARNGALRKLQQSRKNATLSLDELSVHLISSNNNPEEAFLTTELLQKIDAAVNELPPRCKIIYKLAKEDKLKYKEIAQLLNINVKTIDNQLATALSKIASAINFRLKKHPTP